jgi:hypothetical protein
VRTIRKTDNRFYSINQKDAETKEGLGKDGMSMRSQNRLDCLYHELKEKKRIQ